MWIVLLIVSIVLVILLIPITPISSSSKEGFSVYDGITETLPPLEYRNSGQKEEEEIHQNDVLSRITPYIPSL